MPITELYYRDANAPRDVKFHHILIFAVSGSLLIACSLFNYVTLFLCRFRMRRKELALRRVCGASGRSLFVLLSLEFSLSLLAALLLGGVFVRLLYGVFGKLSGVDTELPAIYGESAVYAGAVTAFSLLVFGVVLQIFRRRMPAAAVRSGSRNRSRRASVVVQLFISVGFAFCTAVILKQMYYLHHTDLGFAFKNRGSVSIPGNRDWDVLRDRMSQLPEIGEVFCAQVALAPVLGRSSYGIGAWDEKPEDAPSVNIEQMSITEQYASYYEMRLTAGEMLRDSDPETLVMINESAAKAFGWHEPVGKKFNRYTVKGVLKNIYNFAPTVPAKPFFYNLPGKNAKLWNVLFRYREGSWETCREKIKEITGEVYPEDSGSITVYNTEEEYDKFLKSENALLKILTFVSSVCILICVFGFVSLISLTCEERRREMAIRKINGARVRDVLGIFIRENLVLLLAGSGLAFVAGYYVMRLWLEQYVVRTAMSWWIYVLIVCAMALVIVLCVGWRVYRASIENPAEVVKRE
jgi:ABC-type antimicrobial peptide transport system permease subunit